MLFIIIGCTMAFVKSISIEFPSANLSFAVPVMAAQYVVVAYATQLHAKSSGEALVECLIIVPARLPRIPDLTLLTYLEGYNDFVCCNCRLVWFGKRSVQGRTQRSIQDLRGG